MHTSVVSLGSPSYVKALFWKQSECAKTNTKRALRNEFVKLLFYIKSIFNVLFIYIFFLYYEVAHTTV